MKTTTTVFTCDRCGAIEKPRTDLQAEDDDGFPRSWARVTFVDSQVNWNRDLCSDCANDVGRTIRRADVKTQ
jgi:hypothetical protein